MPITASDLASFNTFVAGRMVEGGADSLVELARVWEAERRDYDETVAELRESVADMEAGKGRPFGEFVAEMRAKYNIPSPELASRRR